MGSQGPGSYTVELLREWSLLFQLTQYQSIINPETWVQGLGERCVKCVRVIHPVSTGDKVGKCTSLPVQIHPHSSGRIRWRRHHRLLVIVTSVVTIVIRTEQNPGYVIHSQFAVIAPTLSVDTSVSYPIVNGIAGPLSFPVEASSTQGLSAQDLSVKLKPVRMVRVRILISSPRHLLVTT